jgi:phospholipase/carboxylesterase
MPQLPLVSLQATSSHATPGLIVMAHGVGSHERDLFDLANLFQPWFHVVSLRAPIALAQGFAWFPVTFTPTGSRIDPQAEISSRALLSETIAQLQQELNVPPERTWMFGFSQGAIMSYNMLLTHPDQLAGAVAMNGRLLPEVWPHRVPDAELAGKALLMCHTRQDQVLSIELARQAHSHFTTLPLQLTFKEFDGPHTITQAALTTSLDWLEEQHRLSLNPNSNKQRESAGAPR